MEQEIRHKRLHAFFESKVLNILIMVTITGLLIMACSGTMLLPVFCSTLALLLFIGYSLWLWLKKPAMIIINPLISNICSLYVLYFMIIAVVKPANDWWYIIPSALSVAILFIALTTYQDQHYNITP